MRPRWTETDVPEGHTVVEYRQLGLRGEASVGFRWWQPIPTQAWAMLQAGDVLFVAGPEQDALGSEAALAGQSEAILLAVSTADGHPHAHTPLPSPPVWDGMAAADGCLFLATRDGRVLCLASASKE
jgi:hypothetical protein